MDLTSGTIRQCLLRAILSLLERHESTSIEACRKEFVHREKADFSRDELLLLCHKLTRRAIVRDPSCGGRVMNLSVSGQAREERFAAYVDGLAEGLGHADRMAPMQVTCP